METLDTLARHLGSRGEVVLRRRRGAGAAVEELIVNGVFAMDSTDTWTERKLAEVALAGSCARRVLVGGLGLGYTAAELLAADVEHLDVVEIEDCLVDWAYAGITPTLAAVAADARVALHTGDVAAVLTGRQPDLKGPWDAILLDVDNGPAEFAAEGNDALYGRAGLYSIRRALRPRGVLAVWSAWDDRHFARRLDSLGFAVTLNRVRSHGRRGARHFIYRAVPRAQA
jgi:spermidine synthase